MLYVHWSWDPMCKRSGLRLGCGGRVHASNGACLSGSVGTVQWTGGSSRRSMSATTNSQFRQAETDRVAS